MWWCECFFLKLKSPNPSLLGEACVWQKCMPTSNSLMKSCISLYFSSSFFSARKSVLLFGLVFIHQNYGCIFGDFFLFFWSSHFRICFHSWLLVATKGIDQHRLVHPSSMHGPYFHVILARPFQFTIPYIFTNSLISCRFEHYIIYISRECIVVWCTLLACWELNGGC